MNANLRFSQKQAEMLEKDLMEKSIAHAKHISDLKFQIAMADAELQEMS